MTTVFLRLACLLILTVTLADHPHARGLQPTLHSDLLKLQTTWWNWVFCTNDDDDSTEADNVTVTPTFSMDGCADQALVPEGYFFLAGSGKDANGTQIIYRTCADVPDDVTIVIPVVNFICDEPFFEFCENLTLIPEDFTVDGKDFKNVTSAAKEDDLKELGINTFTCRNSRMEEYVEQKDYPKVNNWYFGKWLIIDPLPVGEHAISVRGSIPEFPFSTNVTHTLTVVAETPTAEPETSTTDPTKAPMKTPAPSAVTSPFIHQVMGIVVTLTIAVLNL